MNFFPSRRMLLTGFQYFRFDKRERRVFSLSRFFLTISCARIRSCCARHFSFA